jgi:predicted RNA-binding protein associated with RNAse of E/G family
MDWQLDLLIEPDGTVHWKDEDHLEQALELGILDSAEVRHAREEAERVLEEWPFPTGWEGWAADPAWPLPELPDKWNVV